MKQNHRGEWCLRRSTAPASDAQRRWDHAYQHLLDWATQQGDNDASRDVCARVQQTSGPGPDDRAAIGERTDRD